MAVYQHFRRDEKEFVDQVLHWKESVERSHVQRLTDFLDPRQQFIVQSIVGSNSDVKCHFFGGYKDSERKRALIYPYYLTVNEADFLISLFEINYPHKFINLNHRDVLGSLMSLGITRGKFGDILLNCEKAQFLATNEMKQFIEMELTSIGRATVSIKEIPLSKIIASDEKWQDQLVNVSSLRVDALISSIFRLSRQRAQQAVQRELVKVNWKTINDPSFSIGEGDVISVRRFGRVKLISIAGKTRKERYQINVGLKK